MSGTAGMSIIYEGQNSIPSTVDPTRMISGSDPVTRAASIDQLVINNCAEFFARAIVLSPNLGGQIIALSGLPTPGIDLNALALFLRNTQVNMPSITDPPGAGSGGIITLQQLAVNRHRLALSFATSMEHNAALINGYYQQFLGRNADASGLQGWLNFLALGGRAEDVLTGILRSDEYFARNGSTNDGFVKALYHDLLGRTASAAEVAGWVHALGTLSRAAVIGGFLNSDEYRSDLLGGWYQAYLDAGGQASWLAQMRAGMSWEEVQANILTSAEFQARVSNLASDANRSFIIGLYLHVLGRSASNAEVAGWVGVLTTP